MNRQPRERDGRISDERLQPPVNWNMSELCLRHWMFLCALAAAGVWSYWPTVLMLLDAWETEPDYSHGYLVIPLAVYFLWSRRETCPRLAWTFSWPGLVLLLVSLALRILSVVLYAEILDGWSIPFCVGGTVWLLGGWQLFRWALPSLSFLFFMIPLPNRFAVSLSLPLQSIATQLSCWGLQILGQPAIAEGHTILIGSNQIEVEQACSGLRIFLGIIALAFACAVLVRRPWWERGLILLSSLPLALFANAVRIVVTGLLFQYISGEVAEKFAHDVAGWLMIPLAAAMFGLFLVYLARLFPEADSLTVADLRR